jgi:hypothetical protein
MYGGLFSQENSVYLLTADGDMAPGARQLDFRKSIDNGASWTSAIRITEAGSSVFRARVVASGTYVHVVGMGSPTPQGSVLYFRSTEDGATWEAPVTLASNLGPYGGGQTVAVDGATVHVAYTQAVDGPGAGPTLYIRSTDHGGSWSSPVVIGESSTETSRQARVQLVAKNGHVFACWQREAAPLAPLLADRLGYNRSSDGGMTWGTAQVLPGDSGVDRNHQHVWMSPNGGVHLLWRIGNGPADPAGYMLSPDHGSSWGQSAIAVDTQGLNHPWSLVADDNAAHVLTGPDDSMQYARRVLR